jgi:hypothetical protein
MVAVEVTSPARPRSSASARSTAASISSGDRKASGQSREVMIATGRAADSVGSLSHRERGFGLSRG